MTTTWTLPAADIITDALQILGAIGAGQTASDDDYSACLTALQNIIKELPLHGVSWPKITATPVALAWDAAAPENVTLPADYYGVPQVSRIVNGQKVAVDVIAKAAYDALPSAPLGGAPLRLYIAPNNVGYLWPVPDADPGLSLTYQAIGADVDLSARPDVAQTWISGLGYWLAYEVCPKFGIDMMSRADIEKRYLTKRSLMLSYAAELAPITFGVAD
jgi:hypothetical protein